MLAGLPEQLVDVTDHAWPAELADEVDHLSGLAAADREITAVDDPRYPPALEVGDDRVKRGEVPVDVGDDREHAAARSSYA